MEKEIQKNIGMKVYITTLIQNDWSLNLKLLPENCNTKYIAITGDDNFSKVNLRKTLANYFVDIQKTVVTDKSDLDYYENNILFDAMKRAKEDKQVYTLQLMLSFLDGLLSIYLEKLRGRCDYFIFDRSPIDQYSYCYTVNEEIFSETFKIQKPERFEKIDYYIHLDCKTSKIKVKEGENENVFSSTRLLYDKIVNGSCSEFEFLRSSKHYYIDATNLTNEQLVQKVISWLENN